MVNIGDRAESEPNPFRRFVFVFRQVQSPTINIRPWKSRPLRALSQSNVTCARLIRLRRSCSRDEALSSLFYSQSEPENSDILHCGFKGYCYCPLIPHTLRANTTSAKSPTSLSTVLRERTLLRTQACVQSCEPFHLNFCLSHSNLFLSPRDVKHVV
jgi:hypothetical protein